MEVAGEEGRLLPPDLVHRRPRDVTGAVQFDLEPRDVHSLPEFHRDEVLHSGLDVRWIERTRVSLRVRDLEAVLEQHPGHAHGGGSGNDLRVVLPAEPGDHPAVVEMAMGQEGVIDWRSGHRVHGRFRGSHPVLKHQIGVPMREEQSHPPHDVGASEELHLHFTQTSCARLLSDKMDHDVPRPAPHVQFEKHDLLPSSQIRDAIAERDGDGRSEER